MPNLFLTNVQNKFNRIKVEIPTKCHQNNWTFIGYTNKPSIDASCLIQKLILITNLNVKYKTIKVLEENIENFRVQDWANILRFETKTQPIKEKKKKGKLEVVKI